MKENEVGHVSCMGEDRSVQGSDRKTRKKGSTLKDRSVDAMIGSELILKRLAGGVWSDSVGSG
jgi:hypothetical protein